MKKNVLVWDGFVRSFHWLQLILLAGLWYTGEQALLNWHFLIGYCLLVLIATRLIWGVVGSETARFSHFVTTPSAVFKYFKQTDKQNKKIIGHNPAGGYMVILLILLITVQLTTGLFSTDDVFAEGPFMSLISYDTALFITNIHHINFKLIMLFSGVHITAVLLYQLKKHNLIMPMIVGWKWVEMDEGQLRPIIKNTLIAVVILCILSILVYFFFIKDLFEFWL